MPEGWIGKTVGELDIRRKYSINIMATKENGKSIWQFHRKPFLRTRSLFWFSVLTKNCKVFSHLTEVNEDG